MVMVARLRCLGEHDGIVEVVCAAVAEWVS